MLGDVGVLFTCVPETAVVALGRCLNAEDCGEYFEGSGSAAGIGGRFAGDFK